MPRWTPPRFLNQMMKVMLTTPVLQRIVGGSTALVTFVGRRSGRTFTTPISYAVIDGRVIMTGHRTRSWWRNLIDNPEIEMRLRGRRHHGTASILKGEESIELLARLLEMQPSLARFTGVSINEDGKADRDDVASVAGYTAVVAVDPHPPLSPR